MIRKNLVKYIIVLIAIIALVLSIIAVAKKCKDKFGDTGCPPEVYCNEPFDPGYTSDGKMNKYYFRNENNILHAYPFYPNKKVNIKEKIFIECSSPDGKSCDISSQPSFKKYYDEIMNLLRPHRHDPVGCIPNNYSDLSQGFKTCSLEESIPGTGIIADCVPI